MEENPQVESGESIDARQSQGFLNRPTGPVTQNFGTVTYEAAKLRTPIERPARAEHFQDRKEELAQLLTDLQPGKVVALCGPGGMGKSALAAEAVWSLAPNDDPPERFPDGILFRTFRGQNQVASAFEYIAHSFGEELKPTPKEAAQRALAGRRVLLLLDGTEEADDLQSLLEIRNNCGVLITSRSRKDAQSIRQDLAPLPSDDAIALLQAWGGERAADHTAAQEISQLVDCLPLALRLVGRYLAQNEEDANDYLIWLKETPLAALDQGKRQEESIPLLLERSLAQVSERSRQVLGVVGILAPAPFETPAIVYALSLAEREAKQALGELVNYGLLVRQEVGYEVSHALVHTYVSRQLVPLDEVVVRLGAYYQQEIDAHKNDFARLHPLRPHVMTLLSIAGERKIWQMVRDLASKIDNYLHMQGYWVDRITAVTLNLASAQARQNRHDEGALLGNLGNTYYLLGQSEQAITYIQQALMIAKELDNRGDEGVRLGNLGSVYDSLGQAEQAIDCFQQALVIAKEIGNHSSESTWLGGLGSIHYLLGRVAKAIDYYQQALAIDKKIGDRNGEGRHLGSLGTAYDFLGQVEKAIDCHQQALSIAKEIGDRNSEGRHLGNLGRAYFSLKQVERAINHYQQALTIAKEIGDRRNEGIWLANLGLAHRDLRQVNQSRQDWQEALHIFEQINSPVAATLRDWLQSLKNLTEPALTEYVVELLPNTQSGESRSMTEPINSSYDDFIGVDLVTRQESFATIQIHWLQSPENSTDLDLKENMGEIINSSTQSSSSGAMTDDLHSPDNDFVDKHLVAREFSGYPSVTRQQIPELELFTLQTIKRKLWRKWLSAIKRLFGLSRPKT